ncbi:MAG TPA: SemiSWEET transporter [Terracidiphilus sp.]|nr:SemiSWEET transporter [Terracidiphilus sp.]
MNAPLLPHSILAVVGTTAAVCTTISFVPQLVHVVRRKSARDISLAMFLLFVFGTICWLLYGIGIGSLQVTVANAVTLALALAILVLKLIYDRRPDASTGATAIK